MIPLPKPRRDRNPGGQTVGMVNAPACLRGIAQAVHPVIWLAGCGREFTDQRLCSAGVHGDAFVFKPTGLEDPQDVSPDVAHALSSCTGSKWREREKPESYDMRDH